MSALVVVLVVVAVVAAGLWAWRQDQRRRATLAEFARNRGWLYVDEDSSLTRRYTFAPFGQGDRRHARNVLRGQQSGHGLVAFDYSYRTRSDSRNNGTTHRYAVCALSLPGPLPLLQVTPENLLTRFGNALGLADIELESEDFNRRFRVHANDPKFASDVLTARTMQLLLARPAFSWRIAGTDVVSWQDGRLSPAGVLMAAATLSEVVAGIPTFVWRDRGVEPDAAGSGETVG